MAQVSAASGFGAGGVRPEPNCRAVCARRGTAYGFIVWHNMAVACRAVRS